MVPFKGASNSRGVARDGSSDSEEDSELEQRRDADDDEELQVSAWLPPLRRATRAKRRGCAQRSTSRLAQPAAHRRCAAAASKALPAAADHATAREADGTGPAKAI